MFTINDDLSIYATRGDTVFFTVTADENGTPYTFQAGDALRIKIYEKKNAENVVLEKCFPVTAATTDFTILLTEEDTKIGEVISKAKDYWYEIELNPFTNPQTIIGYDEDGAKVFKLFPEGADSDVPEVEPEDIPVVDVELDMTSNRPVQNQAISRAIVNLEAAYRVTKEEVEANVNHITAITDKFESDMDVERARIDAILADATPEDSELIDIRVDVKGVTHGSAGAAVRSQIKNIPVAKNAVLIVNGKFEVDTTAGTITASDTFGEAYVYDNDSYVWLKNLDNRVLNYRAITEAFGSDSSWAYVIDTETKKLDFKRLYDVKDNAHLKPTDIVIFVCVSTAQGDFGKFASFTNEMYLDGNLQKHYSNIQRSWNKIVGSLGGRIDIDTSAKTLRMNGLFFLESGMWKSVDKTINLTSYPIGADGETVRITLNADNELEANNLEVEAKYGDVFICNIFAGGTWGFDHTRIYTDTVTKTLIYVDGEVLVPDIKALSKSVAVMEGNTSIGKTTCKIFKRVACCGDSYTSGHMTDPDGTVHSVMEEYAWPHYMSKLTGNDWINCGQSGANAVSWQTSWRGLTKAKDIGKVQAYILGLMINDCGGGENGIDLGTVSDIGTDATNYYGGMSKIIRELNAISPKAKIFVCTCPRTSGNYPAYNQAVYNIVSAYKNTYPVHCLDLLAKSDMFGLPSLVNDEYYGHYTATGYEQFAEILSVILSDYINEHTAEFRDVAFIEYDVE